MMNSSRCLAILVACAAVAPGDDGFSQEGLRGGRDKYGDRSPSHGGGPVQSENALKYDAGTLKAQSVPEISTDNKNTLVLKYPGKLLLNASSIWDGWPEALAFDGNPHSSWFTAKG